MKAILPLVFILTLVSVSNAQLISRFTWDNGSPATATYGPNPISISSHAFVDTAGRNGSKGLNAGGQYDINMVLDGSYFNVPALDISVDFRKEESQASFFYRGTYFNFGMNNGYLAVNFQLNDSLHTIINSGNIIALPNDHAFHTYRFTYDDNTGTAKVSVDDSVKYSYTGTAGRGLYWTGAGNVTIGKDMDATGKNVSILDNLVIQQHANALLPVKLLSFSAVAENKYAAIKFSATEETGVSAFVVERSSNGVTFNSVAQVSPKNSYSGVNQYAVIDSLPFTPVTYYRLKTINNNGSVTYAPIQTVKFETVAAATMSVYPNPAVNFVTIKLNNARAAQYQYKVSAINGQVISMANVQLNSGEQLIRIDLTRTPVKGMLVIELVDAQSHAVKTFSVIKA